jgi:uncharacterized protein (TIGR02147 family)
MAAARRNKPSSQIEVHVFDYLDYRAYLRAYYDAAKRRPSGFSFRAFSKRAGFSSPNFFKLVIDGERNISADSVGKFADALGLDENERGFFSDLVSFDQAETKAEKNRAFERLASSRRFRSARRIDSQMHEYLSHWYHPAIRELITSPDFQEEATWIATKLHPAITAKQAAHSLQLLLDLGLVVRNSETKRLELREPTLTTEHEVMAIGAANFHKQMLERASESIDTIPSSLRDLAALTVCVSADRAKLVKERIHQFREAMTELCENDPVATTVYQLNVQWFPLTRTEGESR